MTASIHHEEIRKDAHRITKLADYVDKYDWSNIKKIGVNFNVIKSM